MKILKTFDTKLTGTDEEILCNLAKKSLKETELDNFRNNIRRLLSKILVKQQKMIRFDRDDDEIGELDIRTVRRA